jgi:hypothetical protein
MWMKSMFTLLAVVWVVATAAGAIPPLTDEQIVRLETAHDGRDHREEAFIALVENIRAWDGDIGDTLVRLEPNIDAMLDDPDSHRGTIVRLTGRIAQIMPLTPPYEGVLECFIRDEENRPLLVYIVQGTTTDNVLQLRESSSIEVFARFYKRVDFTARDGAERSYAAFVGAHPRIVSPVGTGVEITYLTVISIALLVLLIVFIVLIVIARRQRKDVRRVTLARISTESIPPELDDVTDLPDDPAEALSELRRRMKYADH